MKTMVKHVLWSTCTIFFAALCLHAVAQDTYKKVPDGIVVNLSQKSTQDARLLRLQVVSDNIIHVTATPENSFPSKQSLMALQPVTPAVNWHVVQKGNHLLLSTSSVTVHVWLPAGTVSFTDKSGKVILNENPERTFTPISNNGESSYHIIQSFHSQADEAIYGLGQHQNGIVNFKNQHLELLQNNTEVAVPFLVSSKNYGILWDNYSLTKFGDTRDYQPISGLKLFAADGSEGWLTATYAKKIDTTHVFAQRAESDIDYSSLETMKNFPQGYKLGEGKVSWTGSIASAYTGSHQFWLKYAGYVKIWIDGKLLADRWRQGWNPGTAVLNIDLIKGKKYPIKIEWFPDADESFIALKWLAPLSQAQQNKYAFDSESGDQLNYYFVYGKNADDVISGYRTVTGKAVMMPRWAMGFWQSRERYKTQAEILNTVKEFRDRKIPLDNIVEDWSYWKEDQWGSQDFDETRFPDPTGMIGTLHDRYHTHFMISVWPKFYEGINSYQYFDKNGWLYKRNIANHQRDWIGKGYFSTFYDAYNPKAREAFWDLMNKKLYSKGVDAWWMDASEPDITSNLSIQSRKDFMNPTYLGSSTQYFNAFPLQNAKGIYEGQRSTNPNSRVFLLTRSAYAGLQRYAAATWSGDIAARWDDMKNQIPAGINFALSGIPYWTMDIGGFAVEHRYEQPNERDLAEWREQMTRWYQFGSFVPLFRVHGQFPYREIYNVAPENHPAYQSMLFYDKLRYRLMPYIYSLAGMAYHRDYTLMRGLIMDYGRDEKVKNIADEYLFGPALLINPVCQYGVTSRDVYLPQGNGWYNLYNGKYTYGGQTIRADAPYDRIPVYIKEGSIIPFGPDMQYTDEKPADPISLYVYAGKDGNFTLYEDEGINYNYEKGAFSTIQLSYNEASKTLTIHGRQGGFPGMLSKRRFNIVLIRKDKAVPLNSDSTNTQQINYEGKEVTLKFNL
ncbi:glycoside hydrolase family 31 protein [Mucilaginibacter sabulilitoris]|uniref:Glycoside hydrolase family 31 protein n=1 Tax=Mucilaginibacter sabulilitoris TaxID=1173583 RepID=A0ABZ0TQ11_9SPHI|nr:TIM-barrel domain-containing protein [Mucilaginibacter sabulilitoris]WPU94866.1 glycoside hydrolase family 31 protein [Mucilaginibacter sabulilitoris]